MERFKKIAAVVGVLLIIMGFGMIHNGDPVIETIGSVGIGVGCLYFIVLLLLSMRKS
jgi:hypothetical protein